jgi:hypothetical protein
VSAFRDNAGPNGFASRPIAESPAYDLDGEVNVEHQPGGISCTVDVPMERLIEPA